MWAAIVPIAASIIGGMMKGSGGAGDQGNMSYNPSDNLSSGSNVVTPGKGESAPISQGAPMEDPKGPYEEFTNNWTGKMQSFLGASSPSEIDPKNPEQYSPVNKGFNV